ncbi:MAG: hypothetical protein ACYDGR_13790 [Candidatus Dormibacteria bacterium]
MNLGFLSFLEPLVNPTFIDREHPPWVVNAPAKTIGLVAAVLSAIGVLALLLTLPVVLGMQALASAYGVSAFHPFWFIGLVISILACGLGLKGGWAMYQDDREGKRLVVYALAIDAAGTLVVAIGGGGGGEILDLLVIAVVYYFVIISRWPDEAPLLAAQESAAPGAHPPVDPEVTEHPPLQ